MPLTHSIIYFFFNDTATTEIYTLSLHDALPISLSRAMIASDAIGARAVLVHAIDEDAVTFYRKFGFEPSPLDPKQLMLLDRKSTRLNSSHGYISYAVFCLKKKTKNCSTITIICI